MQTWVLKNISRLFQRFYNLNVYCHQKRKLKLFIMVSKQYYSKRTWLANNKVAQSVSPFLTKCLLSTYYHCYHYCELLLLPLVRVHIYWKLTMCQAILYFFSFYLFFFSGTIIFHSVQKIFIFICKYYRGVSNKARGMKHMSKMWPWLQECYRLMTEI